MRHRAAEKANNDADTPSSEVRRRVGFEEEKSGDSTLSGTGVIDPSSTTKDKKRLSTTVELSHIDKHDRPLEEIKKDLEETVSKVQAGIEHEIDHIEEHAEEHYRSWTDRMHGHRPDRHLFPYRSVKENLRAARTFLRRFFFLILIIPAFVVPYVLKIQAEHKEEHSATPPPGHGANGTNGITTESMLMWASAAAAGGGEASGGGGGGEAEPLLSIGANVVIFILNMLVMMHLGKAAGVALEELEPRFGAVSSFFSFLLVFFLSLPFLSFCSPSVLAFLFISKNYWACTQPKTTFGLDRVCQEGGEHAAADQRTAGLRFAAAGDV